MFKQFFLLSGVLVAGFMVNPTYAEPSNLSLHKAKLIKYHDTGEYFKELDTVAKEARKYLALKVTENNQLPPGKRKKLAVVLDIDETVLSNYPQMVKRDFGGGKEAINHDIELGKDKAIKPMLGFYNFAKQNHVSLFFVTGRKSTEGWITIKNLKAAGFRDWKKLYLKPSKYNKSSIAPYKINTRKAISKLGYTIVASLGDQRSDLDGGDAGKTFKLPNPFYYLP